MKSFFKLKFTKHFVRTATAFGLVLTTSTIFAADPESMNEEQKTLYAIGASVTRSLGVFDLSQLDFDLVVQGMKDAQSGKKSSVDLTAYTGKIQELAKARRKALGEKQAAAGVEFLEKASREPGAVKTASGMVFKPITEGKGDSPKSSDVVRVHYRGTLIDGKEFDSSYKRGKSLEFKLDNVIKCWIEGVQMMKPGGKAKMVCPPQLAYGDKGAGEMILPGATLAFEVELLDFQKSNPPKPASAVKPAELAKK
jgi:FKBP-type peptidyl-prolyl cis-trans isomerase FkpA